MRMSSTSVTKTRRQSRVMDSLERYAGHDATEPAGRADCNP